MRPGNTGDRGPARRNDLACRFLAAVTTLAPASRRGWGQAMLAELDHVRSPRDRAWFALGAARALLCAPRKATGHGRAIRHAAIIAVIAWAPLAAVIFLSNVVYPATEDNLAGLLGTYLYLFTVLMAVGATARRASARPGAWIMAGAVAGVITGVLVVATFAVIDNAFLGIVSHQQAKIDGLRSSGMPSMRAYINISLERSAAGISIGLAVLGAALATLGAQAAPQITLGQACPQGRLHLDDRVGRPCSHAAAASILRRRSGR